MHQSKLIRNSIVTQSHYKAGQNVAFGELNSQEITDNLMGGLPKDNGKWDGERGNSLWIPKQDYVPKGKGIYSYNNMYGKTWKRILMENKCEEGIPFVNGEIDFGGAGVVKAEVTFPYGIGEYFDENEISRGNRYRLHEAAFNMVASLIGESVEDVRLWKEKSLLVWHECCDLRTMQLVPREIHDNIPHQGGIALLKASKLKQNQYKENTMGIIKNPLPKIPSKKGGIDNVITEVFVKKLGDMITAVLRK